MRKNSGFGNGGAGITRLADWRVQRMTCLPLDLLYAYWDALRDGRDMPHRAEVDPRGIEKALEHAFIAERIAPGVARFRIAGMHLSDLLGMEPRGMPLTAIIEPEARSAFADVLERVFDNPAVAEFTLQGPAGFGRPRLEGRMLLLPLRDEEGKVSCAMGGLVAEGGIGRAPRRLEPMQNRLVALATPEADGTGVLQDTSGFSEPAERFVPAPGSKNRPYLRLVKND